MATNSSDRELKKGSTELLILSLVEFEPRRGYELSKLIESRSRGIVRLHVASLYPRPYRIEKRGWIAGPRGGVTRLVVGHGMMLAKIGICAGLAGAYGLTRFLSTLLFGVGATDAQALPGLPWCCSE